MHYIKVIPGLPLPQNRHSFCSRDMGDAGGQVGQVVVCTAEAN